MRGKRTYNSHHSRRCDITLYSQLFVDGSRFRNSIL